MFLFPVASGEAVMLSRGQAFDVTYNPPKQKTNVLRGLPVPLMDQQNSQHFLYSPCIAKPVSIQYANNNMRRSSVRSPLNTYYGGEPMKATNSNISTYSNVSHWSASSEDTVSTTSTYGSIEPQPFMTSYNAFGMAGGGYSDNSFNKGHQQMSSDFNLPPSSGTVSQCTPSSLEWTPQTEFPKLYNFFLEKGKLPYLELLPEFQETPETPKVVILDEPR